MIGNDPAKKRSFHCGRPARRLAPTRRGCGSRDSGRACPHLRPKLDIEPWTRHGDVGVRRVAAGLWCQQSDSPVEVGTRIASTDVIDVRMVLARSLETVASSIPHSRCGVAPQEPACGQSRYHVPAIRRRITDIRGQTAQTINVLSRSPSPSLPGRPDRGCARSQSACRGRTPPPA
jgi:hypothetical protein